MADERFFNKRGPFTLRELAEIGESKLHSNSDPDAMIHDVAPLDKATSADISFLDNPKYIDAFINTRAKACIVLSKMISQAPKGMSLLLSSKPYRSYARIANKFYPDKYIETTDHHGTAVISKTAKIGTPSFIGANAVISDGVEIGDLSSIGSGASIGTMVNIGKGTHVGENASLSHCIIGNNCNIHPGVRIGQRGFGFDMSPDGHLDVAQLGTVIVGDNVEIGANSCIDRGSGPNTVIGDGCKIDNLVQIGHNVQIGPGCVVVAQAGIAGSASLEKYVVLGGQSGVAGHIRIAEGTQLAGRSGIMRNTNSGDRLAGNPAVPIREFFRQISLLSKLSKDKKL
ncbi:MAG: UDP-3-O-(3-hydroxymyristoyl)glucosamine N-acyltransferase [Alphaproteobacteria bacterium]|nr:UDP-3-O-(3-hydroxymyristoyl)glucosamine N-acyltransferase [Alphaproteobacteria bacterium]PPR12670.1 MAG: UDP-3-O-acylglucosamine N-acyltransferase [Alphaproteobacteria bacterium MarineAlpha12_Bin1]|tara:strand:- start:3278 stop:4303 length:1026 start_codon:yes stop_codon:yes gene_type:complete